MPQPASVTPSALRVDKLFPRPNLEPRMKKHLVRMVNEMFNALIKDTLLQDEPGSLDSSREEADHLLLFNADLVQHATLSTLVSPSGQQPRRYVGVKWALVASPSVFPQPRLQLLGVPE
ncbi:hypothetical protein PR001_g22831 [Phytophthora rubi]|uniref:Uncharacterized protein n=1 Tax=Phytophthora rubi TaxID=129364 RepID=A0A6A3IRD0_9STRA|nr:hypothetical protein PR002_g23298 [Phytophthora rubi]KAE8985638.1 hypothetical protein PR001_g22831 [Phytophthora rubi]